MGQNVRKKRQQESESQKKMAFLQETAMSLQRGIRLGRLFVRAYVSRGRGFEISPLPMGFSVWIGRLLCQAFWIHKKSCQCDDCVWESFMGITDGE